MKKLIPSLLLLAFPLLAQAEDKITCDFYAETYTSIAGTRSKISHAQFTQILEEYKQIREQPIDEDDARRMQHADEITIQIAEQVWSRAEENMAGSTFYEKAYNLCLSSDIEKAHTDS